MVPKRSSSKAAGGGAEELTRPGQRSGEGAGSVLPYLHESLATKPGDLLPDEPVAERVARGSMASRVRRALRKLKK